MVTFAKASVLAINGGTPVRTNPFPFWPHYEEEDIAGATQTYRTGKVNYWTGEEGRAFEREYAAHTRQRYAVALANGTVALELALRVLDIGPGDEVITTSRTFIASASCAAVVGARPVLADVERDSGNVTAQTLEAAITPNTRALVVVHLAGWPCDMDPILALAGKHGLDVIEDCAQAHGAEYKGRPAGSFGHISAFSFCQDKIITTGGEGGMVVTSDEDLWKRSWAFKDHGKDYDLVYNREHPSGFRWLHESFGTNWRLTEAQSAIGRRMLRRLPQMLAKRQENAAQLIAGLADQPGLRIPLPPSDVKHSYYRFYVYVEQHRLRDGWNRDRVSEAITAEGIPCFSGACSEIYLERAFPAEWRPVGRLPVARELGETTLMFPVHSRVGAAEIADTITAVRKVLGAATR